MLPIDNLEIDGIRALGRHPTSFVGKHILARLSHPDSAVVKSALDEMLRIDIDVPRNKVRSLLSSANANVRWTALEWVSAQTNPEDLPFVSPLLTKGRKRAGA